MCIILTCESRVRPDYELVDTCFRNNPDGAGLMWVEDGRVQVEKGFYSPSELYAATMSTPIKSPVVLHMRIATSGGISTATCHPFPITDDMNVLHAASVECDAAVAHNGVILGVGTSPGVSDTIAFVSALSKLWRGRLTNRLKRRILDAAPDNRFAFMTSDGEVRRVGDGWNTVTYGIQASNGGWRYRYALDWDDDEYFDEYSCDYFGWGYEPTAEQEERIEFVTSRCGDCFYAGTCAEQGLLCYD